MEGRLKTTIKTLAGLGAVGMITVLFLAYHAGLKSENHSIMDVGSLPAESALSLAVAALVAVGISIALFKVLRGRVIEPVEQITEYSQSRLGRCARHRATRRSG